MSAGCPSGSSVFADEGTAAHQLAEWCLTNAKDPADYPGDDIEVNGEGYPVTGEMCDAVAMYLEAVRSRLEPGDELCIECNLDGLTNLHPDFGGTSDCGIIKRAKRRVVVLDFKYGRGVRVEVENNKQEMTYGLGFVLPLAGIDEVELVVVQPRCYHPGGPVRSWVVSVEDLLDWSFTLVAAAEATEKPDAPLVAGDHCGFCPAAGFCKELARHATQKAMVDFMPGKEIVVPPEPDKMTAEQIGGVLVGLDMLEQWGKRVKAYGLAMGLAGNPPPGHKIVAADTRRKWKDEEEAKRSLVSYWDEDRFCELFVPPKLKTPAQVEKVLGKKASGDIAHLITGGKGQGGPVLVPLSDARPVLKRDAALDFQPTE